MAFQPLAMSGSERDMIDAGINPEVTIGKGEDFKKQFENLIGITYAKFQTKLSGVTGAKTKLARYKALVEELPVTKDSVLEQIVRIVDSIFGETGKIDQISNLIGFTDDEYEGNGMDAFIEADQKKRNADWTPGTLISATDALAYIIAADLARAEDDQGRLSDADIQRNLNKIRGFGATTREGQLRAIEEVIRTIDNQDRSLAVIDRITTNGMATGVINREDRRFLAADKQARKARNMYMQSIAGMEVQTQESGQAMTADDFVNETPTITVNGVKYYQMGPAGSRVYYMIGEDNNPTVVTPEDFMEAYNQSMSEVIPEAQPDEVSGQQMSGSAGAVNMPPSSQSAAATTDAAGALLPDERGNLSATQSNEMPADTSGSFASPAAAATAVAQPDDDLIPATKFARYKPFTSGGYTAFYNLSKGDGTPRLFSKVVKEVNGQQRTFYREIK